MWRCGVQYIRLADDNQIKAVGAPRRCAEFIPGLFFLRTMRIPRFLRFFHTRRAELGDGHIRLMNGYVTMQLCLALEEIGLFRELGDDPRAVKSIKELAETLQTDEHLLRASIEFLSMVTNLFEKDGDYISFRDPTGHREAAWTFWLMRAYKPVLDATAELLRSTKTYGKDMKRDGYWLQKWSDTMTREAVLAALRLIPKDKEATLVDLGCGSADSLIAFCAGNTSRLGIGIDVDPLIAKLARQRVTDAGIGERIRIIHADILDLPQWQTNIQKTGEVVFLASGVLHELLRSGEGPAIRFLRDLKTSFPGSRFLMVESNAPSLEELRTMTDAPRKLAASAYRLLHSLSDQGMPQPEKQWREILRAAGWTIARVVPLERKQSRLLVFYCR